MNKIIDKGNFTVNCIPVIIEHKITKKQLVINELLLTKNTNNDINMQIKQNVIELQERIRPCAPSEEIGAEIIIIK